MLSSKIQDTMQAIDAWMADTFPELHVAIKWNQPMYLLNQTFIIAFSHAKTHLSVAPEQACLDHFYPFIQTLGLTRSKELLKIPWDAPVPYDLLESMIRYNMQEKAEYQKLWR